MSSTLNVKGDRKIVVSSYTTEAVFKIPDGVDLEDKTVVSGWGTKYGKLYISYVNSDEELEIHSVWDTEIDYKYSSDEVIADAEHFNVEYEEDNERKCRDCDYTWTAEDFEAGKGRVAFSHPCEGINEGDVVCTMCHVKGFECEKCKTWIQRDSEAHDNSIVKHDDTNPLVDQIFCQNCEPKCDSDSDNESDDGWNKEYRITDIDFDNANHDVLEEFGIEDWDEFNKALIKETCSKTWIANCQEKLCDKISDETGWLISSFSCERVCTINHKVKEDKYEVRVLRTISTGDDDSDNTDDEGLLIVSSKTFTDIDEARLYFNENVKSYKLLQDDQDFHVEFDDITHEFDPEMIERWSMKDEATDETEEDECPFCKGEKCNISHPPYFCDNGCGKIVGCGVDDECVRTCSCEEAEALK